MGVTLAVSGRQTHGYRVYVALRRRICAFELPPGAALAGGDIAAEFNVSHIPVREAFAALAQDGFIEHVPGRGYSVRALGLQAMRMDFEMIYFAAKLASDAVIRAGGARDAAPWLDTRAIEALGPQAGPDDYVAELEGFYRLMLEEISNPAFTHVVACAIDRTHVMRHVDFAGRRDMASHCRERRAFVDTLRAGDGGGAHALIDAAFARRVADLDRLLTRVARLHGLAVEAV